MAPSRRNTLDAGATPPEIRPLGAFDLAPLVPCGPGRDARAEPTAMPTRPCRAPHPRGLECSPGGRCAASGRFSHRILAPWSRAIDSPVSRPLDARWPRTAAPVHTFASHVTRSCLSSAPVSSSPRENPREAPVDSAQALRIGDLGDQPLDRRVVRRHRILKADHDNPCVATHPRDLLADPTGRIPNLEPDRPSRAAEGLVGKLTGEAVPERVEGPRSLGRCETIGGEPDVDDALPLLLIPIDETVAG